MASFRTPVAILVVVWICGNAIAARAQGPMSASPPPMPFLDPQEAAPLDSPLTTSPDQHREGIVRLSYATAAFPSEVNQDNWAAPAPAPAAPVTPAPVSESSGWDGHWIFGADYLFTRPHFSEATAFVRGTETASSFNATAQALDFQYTSSFRVFAGYQFDGTDTQLRFTYTRFNDQTEED